MEWRDEGIILEVKSYSDHQLRVMLMTPHNGRHAGIIRVSRRRAGTLLPGTRVQAHWRGRLAEHLGTFSLEPLAHDSALIVRRRDRFAALLSACALTMVCVPEREPNLQVFEDIENVVNRLSCDDWRSAYALFELNLLQHVGFRLELDRCAASGTTEKLVYISPRSGQAVSEAAGAPYRDRLFRLPPLFQDPAADFPRDDWREALSITGHFLETRVLSPLGLHLPHIRQHIILNC